jgi:hypothetical protein
MLNSVSSAKVVPIILKAGFCLGSSFFGAVAEEPLLPPSAFGAPELAPAAFSAAGVLDLSDIVDICVDNW